MIKPNYKLAELQQNFKTFYDENLRQKYEQLEPIRQKYLNKFWFRFIVSTAIVLITICLCCTGFIRERVYSSDWFIRLAVLAIVVMVVMCCIPFSDYCAETKSLVMNKILSFWGTFEYSFVSTIDNSDIDKSEIFPYHNREETDDSFAGIYNGTKISVAEKELRVKGNKHDCCVFDGVIILLKFNKKFKGKTVVKNRVNFGSIFKNNLQMMILLSILCISGCFFTLIFVLAEDLFEIFLFASIALFFGIIVFICFRHYYLNHNKKATQKVKLEAISFNKKWHVLTSDQVEARYILTPIFMEKINDIKRLFHGRHIDFGFFDSKLMIAAHTRKNLFETTSLFTPALDYAKVREVVSQLYSIFAVIDVLKEEIQK